MNIRDDPANIHGDTHDAWMDGRYGHSMGKHRPPAEQQAWRHGRQVRQAERECEKWSRLREGYEPRH